MYWKKYKEYEKRAGEGPTIYVFEEEEALSKDGKCRRKKTIRMWLEMMRKTKG